MKSRIFTLVGAFGFTAAQSSPQSPSVTTLTGSQRTLTRDYLPVVTLPSIFSGSTILTIPQSLLSTTNTTQSANSNSNSTSSTRTTVNTQEPLTNIGGATRSTSIIATRTTSTRPSNTQPCNNYVEFCMRKYSNITEIAAHNSPFTRQNNVQRNQDYDVTAQLNDGIRVLQGQAHWVNNTLYMCHTSCDLLNAGTVESYLREVVAWLDRHPFEVVTILFGNYNWADKDADGNSVVTSIQFDAAVRASGLYRYIYQPPKTAMALDDWPTLGQMILSQKRVVTFIDYGFNTDAVPYILWQYYNVWETPFSPTDPSFPCVLGRPEGISEDQQRNMMYLANHNLNTEVAIAGLTLLVPNVAQIAETNAVEGFGSLGKMSRDCADKWGRPPNMMIVDFYNQGPTNGSVFEVAARANGVTYNRQCCGKVAQRSGAISIRPGLTLIAVSIAVVLL